MATLERRVWLRHAFLLPINRTKPNDSGGRDRRRHNTSAAYKFTNTSPGGNYAMNNPPQFTYFADIRHPGLGRREADWKHGMGRYYSEAIDDPKQIIHMSFGVPQYSSWSSFFTSFYDRNAAQLANSGRVSKLWYNAGLIGGYIVSLPLQPFILGFSWMGKVFSFLSKSSPSKWYYFQPTMHNYWSSVNTIANDLAINMGIIPRIFAQQHATLSDDRRSEEDMLEDIQKMHEMYPQIFRPMRKDETDGKYKGGGIDVMTLARRTELMSVKAQNAIKNIKDSAETLEELQRKMREYYLGRGAEPALPNDKGYYVDSREYFEAALDALATNGANDQGDIDNSNEFSTFSEVSNIWDFVTASQRDGSQWVTFRVQHNGSVSESFSNSVGESSVAQQLNAQVSSGRSAHFNFMGGDIFPGIGAIINAFKNFATAALDTVKLSGLATMAGSAFIDIPKYWEGSTANLPTANYTIPLYSPYGNKMSRYLNLMLPMAMVLAGGLPLSAGRSAYTSPFICQVYHQGRVLCQLGMIDSITITRGTGNVGWNAEHEMLGAEMQISVVDLSSILHIPIKAGFVDANWTKSLANAGAQSLGRAIGDVEGQAVAAAIMNSSVWDEQSKYAEYMASISSMSLRDIYYVGNRLSLSLTRAVQSFDTWRSPSNFMSWALDGQPARVLSAFAQFSDRT